MRVVFPKIELAIIATAIFGLVTLGEASASTEQSVAWQKLYDQGQQAYSAGDYSAAEHSFLHALDLLEKSKDNSSRYRQTLLKLTQSLLFENYPGTTEACYCKLRKVIHSRTGDVKADAEFMIGLDDLADKYESKGNALRDPTYLEHALELRTTISGQSHPKYEQTLHNLAMLYSGCYQYQKAIVVLERLTSRDGTLLSNLNQAKSIDPSTFVAYHERLMLGMNYFGAKNYSMADKIFEGLLSAVTSNKALKELAADVSSELASMCFEQKKYSKAEKSCRAAISYDTHRKVPMPFCDPLTFDYLVLGQILDRNGRTEEAEQCLRSSFAMMKSRYGENHLALYFPQKALSEFLSKHGRSSEADNLARANSAIYQRYQHMCPDLASTEYMHHWYIFRLPPTRLQGTP